MSGPTPLGPPAPGVPRAGAGGRVAGGARLAALTRFGTSVTLCDDDPATLRRYAQNGVVTVTVSRATRQVSEYALVVTSPGFSPATPLLAAAATAGVPIWGDVELAWRLDAAGPFRPPRRLLGVTGITGTTHTHA